MGENKEKIYPREETLKKENIKRIKERKKLLQKIVTTGRKQEINQ